MNSLSQYITEKFKISKNIKTNEEEYLLQASPEDRLIYNFKSDKNLIYSKNYIKVYIFNEDELEDLLKKKIIDDNYYVHLISHPKDDEEIKKMKKGKWDPWASNLFKDENDENLITIKDILDEKYK